uniref:Uncharacterized protein n=1 Tax=Oryzias sinensis TaxID=183150 RepID=A0A8C7X1N2_9TELE
MSAQNLGTPRFAPLYTLPAPRIVRPDANPIIKESFAKQLLRSKRQQRPMKAGHPDEPMRVSFIRAGRRTNQKRFHGSNHFEMNRKSPSTAPSGMIVNYRA